MTKNQTITTIDNEQAQCLSVSGKLKSSAEKFGQGLYPPDYLN
jgi:hypothetical protein